MIRKKEKNIFNGGGDRGHVVQHERRGRAGEISPGAVGGAGDHVLTREPSGWGSR